MLWAEAVGSTRALDSRDNYSVRADRKRLAYTVQMSRVPEENRSSSTVVAVRAMFLSWVEEETELSDRPRRARGAEQHA